MKRHFLATTAAAVMLATPALAQDITLKFAVFTPEQEITYQEAMEPWARSVEEATGGKVEIQMYPGGTLGRDGSKQIKMLKDDVADIAFFIPAYNPGLFPDNWVVELPNTSQNATEGSVAFWRLLEAGKLRGYEDLEVLATFVTSPYLLHSSEPVETLEDIEGMKVRIAGKIEQDCVALLDGVPVGMPITKAAESMSRGVIAAVPLHYAALFAFGISDTTDYHYHNALGSQVFGFAMAKERFEELPDDVQAVMQDKGGEALARIFGQAMDAESDRRLAEVEDDPDQRVVIPSEEDRAEWAETMARCSAGFVSEQENGAKLEAAWQTQLDSVRDE